MTLVVNLQKRLEHPSCGEKIVLLDSGFAYDPIELSKQGLKYFGYEYDSSLSFENFLSILTVLQKIHSETRQANKVYIHGHTGNGKACAISACFLIYSRGMNVNQSLTTIRLKRKNAFPGLIHEKFVTEFFESNQISSV